MSGTEVVLHHPVQGPFGVIDRLTFRRAKVRDQVAAQDAGGGLAAQEMRLFGFLTGQPPEVMEEIDAADYERLQKAYLAFMKAPAPVPAKGA